MRRSRFTGTEALVRSVPVHADGHRHHGYGKGYGQPAGEPLLGFEGVAPSSEDTVIVPPGYRADVLIAWGDPVSNGPAFKQDGSNTADEQAQQWGMHNDGIVYFPINGSSKHGIIVQNHEYTDDGMLFTDGVANWSAEKTAKSQNAHGVGIIEVKRRRGAWEVVRPSRFARRITAQTPIEIGGPLAGHALLQTNADPAGTTVLGTINNCAMGYTPWGTYLACEENFNGYFNGPPIVSGTLLARYGIGPIAATGTQWFTTDARFDVAAEPNESNRFGWVCEINPFDPNSTPVKRTALGRLKHEGAWVQEARDGRVVVYMGDDQAFEYIYRYVSNQPWRKSLRRGINPLDDGILYVARFDANGTGAWLPLTPDTVGWPSGGDPRQHAWRGRHRRRHEDGPAGVDRHLSRRVDGGRHAHEQLRLERARHGHGCSGGRRQSSGEQRVRTHHSLGLRHRLHRADVLVGHLRPRRRPRRRGSRRLDDQRRQVRVS